MPHRRDFLKTLAAGAAGTYVTGPGLGHASSLVQAQRPRRRVLEAPSRRRREGSDPGRELDAAVSHVTLDAPGSGRHTRSLALIAPLGAGGMGEVYRARDSRLEREVAIKVLPARLAHDRDARIRFEREAKAVAALNHPNILAIHDFGDHEGIVFVVTELLEGETLRARVSRAPLPWRHAVDIAIAVAEGLSAAHAKGIVHRDLKPENVFLTSDGRVKILDFGLARRLALEDMDDKTAIAITEPGVVMGTTAYMSPEQARGIPASATSDIFSLGCVVFEMLMGRRAFDRATAADTIAAILTEAAPRVHVSDPQAPAELGQIVAQCLEKQPDDRFQSARDLAFNLRGLGSRPVAVAVAGPPDAIDSLAVMPFVNASGNPDTEYLSDGIAETLINSLSQMPRLRVVPRSKAFRYKGQDIDHRKVGRQLKVRALLTGKVLQRGDTLNVQAELVDVQSDAQLWGERFHRTMTDIFTVEEEIAKQISEKLRLELSGRERERLLKRQTENTAAYHLYLRGRYHWNKRTGEGLTRGHRVFPAGRRPGPRLCHGLRGSRRRVFGSRILCPEPREGICREGKSCRAQSARDRSRHGRGAQYPGHPAMHARLGLERGGTQCSPGARAQTALCVGPRPIRDDVVGNGPARGGSAGSPPRVRIGAGLAGIENTRCVDADSRADVRRGPR